MQPCSGSTKRLDKPIDKIVIAREPFDFELMKTLNDLVAHHNGHGIQHDVRLSAATGADADTCPPRAQG
jgi:hypothetical protein